MKEKTDLLKNLGPHLLVDFRFERLETLEKIIKITRLGCALADAEFYTPEEFCEAYDRVKTKHFADPIDRLLACDWFDYFAKIVFPDQADQLIRQYHRLEKVDWKPNWHG